MTELHGLSNELRRKHEELDDFFENAVVPLHLVGSDGTILRANKAELELLGYDRSEYVGRNIREFHADSASIADILERLGRGEQLQRYPARLRTKAGEIKQVLITSSAKFDNGRFVNTRCFTVDVTEELRAKEQAAESEAYFQQVLEALPVAVYTTDAAGRITFYNGAAGELWGHQPEVGESQWCGSWRLYSADGQPLPHEHCPMAIALKEQKAVRGIEAILERPDGTRIPFRPYPTPLKDGSGRVIGAINLLLDLREERAKDIATAELAAIVAGSQDAIIGITLDGRITSWNASAARTYGYEPEEMVGAPISKVIPPDLRQEEEAILSRIRAGERIEHFDTVRIRKDGRRIDVALTVSPIYDRAGKIVGASKIARDVTERKRSEELQNLLFEELNHRVKNTLATIQAIASQSLKRATGPKEFVASFNGRVQALARAHNILVENRMKGSELADLLREQVLLGPPPHPQVSSSGPSVMLDAQAAVQLSLVLHELATNARKYGALSIPDGRLAVRWTVQAQEGKRHLLLTWQESGVPNVTAPRSHGFGTALIERTLTANGGQGSLHYGADGVTCEMMLALPDESHHSHPTQSERTARPDPTSSAQQVSLTGKRILIIEDEPLVAMDLEALLAEAGCVSAGTAATVESALQLIARSTFDAALLDANLSGSSVEPIAAALAAKRVPFTFATGYGPGGLPVAYRERPSVAKPFQRHQLEAALMSLFAAGRGSTIVPFRKER